MNTRDRLSLALCALIASALPGCYHAVASTEVHENGSWSRTVELRTMATDKTRQLKDGPKLEDAFQIPGPPWSVTKEKRDDELVVTCKRSMQAGESLKRDLVFMGEANKIKAEVAANECSVKQTSPGVFTYREIIHWTGPAPPFIFDPGFAKVIKASVPATVATDASIKHLTETLNKLLLTTMFGPPDPLFNSLVTQVMLNPDFAKRNIATRTGEAFDSAIQAEYENRLTDSQRKAAVLKLVDAIVRETSDKANQDKPPDAVGDEMGQLVSVTVAAKLPGKIVSTNGLIDKFHNEVYWGLFPQAAAAGQDIVLTATCQAK